MLISMVKFECQISILNVQPYPYIFWSIQNATKTTGTTGTGPVSPNMCSASETLQCPAKTNSTGLCKTLQYPAESMNSDEIWAIQNSTKTINADSISEDLFGGKSKDSAQRKTTQSAGLTNLEINGDSKTLP